MKQIFSVVMAVAIPFAAAAQEKSYLSETEKRCDWVVISCLHQLDNSASGSCILVLPNDIGGMEHHFEDDQVVEFGELDSESYFAGGDWTDIIVIRDDFLDRHGFAPWNGADEQLDVCQLLS